MTPYQRAAAVSSSSSPTTAPRSPARRTWPTAADRARPGRWPLVVLTVPLLATVVLAPGLTG